MIVRIVLLALVVAASFAIVAGLERRRGRASASLGPGLTLVIGPDCMLCGPAADALAAAGAEPQVVDIRDIPDRSVMSVPTALVVDRSGTVVVRRSGRSIAPDASILAAAAREI